MKKKTTLIVSAIALCFIVCACFVGCSDSADTISSQRITKLYNQYLKDNALSQKFANVNIGYYETTEAERCDLKKLEAAGVITVTFERFAWWEKTFGTKKVPVTTYDWWGYSHTSYVTKKTEVYSFEDHIMANVSLTPAGEKLVVKELPKAVVKKDKYMKQPEFNVDKYPEYSVSCDEDWPEIRNPFLVVKEEVTPEPVQKKDKPAVQKKEQPIEESEDDDKIERKDNAQYLAYLDAAAKVNKTTCTLKGCAVKAIKARNIQIVNENGVSTAVAEIILENQNVSDAYRVQQNIISGMKTTKTVLLTYYLDKGWVVVEEPLMDSMEKFMDNWEKACSMMNEIVKDSDIEDLMEEATEDAMKYDF